MQNFIFTNPTKLCFGKNQIELLKSLIPQETKILLLYGGGSIKKNNIYQNVTEQLKTHTYIEFAGIPANPTYEICMEAVSLCQKENVEFILAVGGGSTIDAAKFIAAACKYEGKTAWDIVANNTSITDALPIGVILTLPATGSEMNAFSVITKTDCLEKRPFYSPKLFPTFAIVDPEYTYSLPLRQIKNGIVDAFTHVMEQYLTYPVDALLQDRFAEGILQTLIEITPNALADNPPQYTARANLCLSTSFALNGVIGMGVPQDWATHMIGHQLTALYGLDHAVSLAIILPAMMLVRRKEKEKKILQYAERILKIEFSNTEQTLHEAIEKTKSFFHQVGIKTQLSDYDIDAHGINDILELLQNQGFTQLGERQDLDIDTIREVLLAAL